MEKKPDRTGRKLSHDELKAAEAAFQGRPFNEVWSQAARAVYDGILAAKNKLNHEPVMREVLVPDRDPRGVEELVGAAAHGGEGERFNGL